MGLSRHYSSLRILNWNYGGLSCFNEIIYHKNIEIDKSQQYLLTHHLAMGQWPILDFLFNSKHYSNIVQIGRCTDMTY